ncbi:MAG: GGDEF domain-containing protein [Psychrobium sp.]
MTPQLVQNIQHRREVMRALLFIICLGGVSFFTINIFREIYFLAFLELSYSIYAVALLRIISKTDNFQRWVVAFLIPLYSLILYALYLPETSKSMFVWILAFPIVSYLLLGKKAGFLVSVLFLMTALIIYHVKFLTMQGSVDIAESLNVVFSSALMISFAHVYEKNRESNEVRLLELAGTDSLTGVPNRLKLYESYSQWLKQLKCDQPTPMSVALIDLDHFKTINDKYGHSAGDEALRHVANFIRAKMPPNALLARIGGEEFTLKITGKELAQCCDFINDLRKELNDSPLVHEGKVIKITFSAGIATYGEDGTSLDALLACADKRLYIAKRQGRNRVCCEGVHEVKTSNKVLC